ncbi:MAG: host attachment protein [Deltaproteobacteria bacterium]|nr:host attachment protein [Deltaproteobacteria bacterium]
MNKQSPAQYLNLGSKVTFYVVASRTEAVFFSVGDEQAFRFVERLSDEKGALHESELVSDRPGRGLSSAGNGVVRHAVGHGETHREQLAKKFAARIAAALDTARAQKRFTEVVLAAEPRFLGLLREALGLEIRALVKHEIPREYVKCSDGEVRARILKAIEKE